MSDSETLSLAGLQAGEYYVKVYGYAGATNTYELQFDINTSSLTPDRFEVNDTLQTATQLRELSGFTVYEELGFHTSNDEDWFAFETVAASNQSNYVSALDHGENGGINLELFDSSGNSIAQDGEYLQFHDLPASQYYLRVTPWHEDQHTYDLVIDAPVLSQSPGDPNRGDWTIMVYITASDLYHFAQSDVNEIEKAVSELPGTVNVTVLWDQSEFGMTYATGNGQQAPWGGTGQAVITADNNMASIRTHFDLLGEKNTGDPSTLVDFVTWSKETAPADNYGLILWDHGAGLEGFNYDNFDPGPSDYLTTQELATAMTGLSQNGPAVDLLSFDACLMSMAEVGYELRNVTDVFVSSQELVGGDGHNYITLLDTLKQNPGSVTAEELGAGFVHSYNNSYAGTLWDTQSAIRTSGFDSLTHAINQLTSAVSNADQASQRIVASTIGHSHSIHFEYLRDLGRFTERLVNHNALPLTIQNAAAAVLNAIQSMVISRTADWRNSSGLSIFLPSAQQGTNTWYTTDYASFNAATNWNSMLSTLRSSGNTNYTQADWLQGGRSALTAFDLGVVAGTGNSFTNLSLFDGQDSDWMKFEVRGGGTTTGDFGISMNSNSNSTLSATLYNAAGTTVGSLLDGRLKIESFEDGIYTLHVNATGEVSDYEVIIDAPNLSTFRGRVVGNNDTAEKATDWGVINGAQIEPGLTLPSRSFGSDNDGWKYFEFQAPRLPGITDWSLSVNTPQNTRVTAELFQKNADSLVEMAIETGSGSLPFSYTTFGESEQYVLRVRHRANQRLPKLLSKFSSTEMVPKSSFNPLKGPVINGLVKTERVLHSVIQHQLSMTTVLSRSALRIHGKSLMPKQSTARTTSLQQMDRRPRAIACWQIQHGLLLEWSRLGMRRARVFRHVYKSMRILKFWLVLSCFAQWIIAPYIQKLRQTGSPQRWQRLLSPIMTLKLCKISYSFKTNLISLWCGSGYLMMAGGLNENYRLMNCLIQG